MSDRNEAVVVAVVVAYNRADLLAEALDALAEQTRPLDRIVVVDNASDDSTPDVLAARPDVVVERLRRNTGGAGGFAAGLAIALARFHADAVWLMDDDTIPTPDALEELLAARAAFAEPPAVIGSRVIWTDGSDHPMNTPRPHPFVRGRRRDGYTRRGLLPVRSSSFVSMLVDGDAAREAGLPIVDYFIWNDDFEYSTRLIRGRIGVFAPRSAVLHKTRILGSTDADPGPRFYYEVRNKLWMFRFSRGLSPFEKLVYGGSSLRRWVRTVLRSNDRGVLLDGLRRGLADGIRTRPRPATVALADAGPVVADVERVERAAR